MKCPVCVEKGFKSTISIGMTTSTLLYIAPYYDEDGNYHHHNRNTMTTNYRCSLGHSWSISKCGRCPSCDFGIDSEKITIHNSEEIVPKDPIEFSTTGNGSISVNSTTDSVNTFKI